MPFELCGAELDARTIEPPSSTILRIYADPLVRAGLEEILKSTRFVVSRDQAGDDVPCDLVIIDERYHATGLSDLITAMKTRHPATRVVVLADRFDLETVVAACLAGVDGFCLTTAGRDVLIHCFELVMLGEVILPSEMAFAAMTDGAGNGENPFLRRSQHPNGSSLGIPALSCREHEVLKALMRGLSNKRIANELEITEATVKVHVKTILRKIGVGNRTQAALWAADHLPGESAAQ